MGNKYETKQESGYYGLSIEGHGGYHSVSVSLVLTNC